MKLIFLISALLSSHIAVACQCAGPGPMDADPVIERLLKRTLGEDIEISRNRYGIEMNQLRAYPTLGDRLALATGMRDTSCHVEGPNGEDLFHCSTSYKSDYEFVLKKEGKECQVVVQVKASRKKAKAKLLSTNC